MTNPCTRFVNSLVYAGVALAGALSVIAGGMSVGGLSCFLSYANQYTKPFNEISGVITELQNALACAARIFELIEEEVEIPDDKDAVVLHQIEGKVNLKKVAFSYLPEQKLIEDLNLEVEPGQTIAIVGPTGCGKSTVLNMAAGLLTPSKGTVKVFGEELVGLNKRAGYMFQAEALMPWRTAIDNVSAGLQFKGVPEKERHEQARHWLSRVGLSGFEDRYPHELSGGMRKRVALAQTLIMDPDIILMDEPFSALDIQTRQLMENEVLALWSQKKKAVLFITHDLDEAISISDRVVVFSAGPGSHPIGEFYIDIARPRDVAEVRVTPRFIELHNAIWADLREEVLKGYENQRNRVK